MILALDLSTKSSGWALFDKQNEKYFLYKSGYITASSTDVIKRISKITIELNKILQSNPTIDTVIMEEVLPSVGHNSNTNVWKALTWLQAAVVFLLHDNYQKINRIFTMPNSWRAKVGIHTGPGIKREELKKQDIELVKNFYNLEVNNDEADAILIGHAYVNKLSNEINWD